MTATNIELDPDILAEAMRLLGTTTKKETVNTALREVVERLKRLEALEKMTTRAARGEFDPAIRAYETRKRAQRGE
ncbi:type II toxin-antitoxin system VapB family antitoxin [Kitasatospora sp. NBC_01266]|uniref:type II toxin-antitoxin system VapB family antitoxin n=1 Tax=Kitasatospora sp. NBC_01266 TaxID=2903572 RepID=UPI002E325726|nr:type II toxin-antitoxin system VapB family antitoxin [Kitasatospora sp. NBC_01266]